MNSNHSFEWLNSFPVHGHTTLYVFSIHFEFCVLFSVIKNVAKNIFVHESFHIYKYNYRIFLAVEWICILIWIQYCLIALQTQSTFLPSWNLPRTINILCDIMLNICCLTNIRFRSLL